MAGRVNTTVGATMRALRAAIAGSIHSDEAAEEIAFHIADIVGDFPAVLALLEAGKKGEKVSLEQLDDALSLICVHWEYHQKALRQLRRKVKAPGTGESATSRTRPQRGQAKQALRSRSSRKKT